MTSKKLTDPKQLNWLKGMTYRENGVLEFTKEAWNELVKLSGTKAKTHQGKKLAIKKLVETAIKSALEKK